MNWQTSAWKDREEMSHAAAAELARIAAEATASRGRFDLGLAGGHTPQRMYEVLATEYRDQIAWKRTHLFWSDERYVGAEDPLSNYRMARDALIAPLAIPPENVHPMPTSFADPEDAARAYQQHLAEHFGTKGPRFDVLLLGIGPEGHTASLFPGSSALAEKDRWVMPVRTPAQPPLRLTLTLPAINAAANVFFLVSGAKKQAILKKLLNLGPAERDAYPAARVMPQGSVILFVDQAARP